MCAQDHREVTLLKGQSLWGVEREKPVMPCGLKHRGELGQGEDGAGEACDGPHQAGRQRRILRRGQVVAGVVLPRARGPQDPRGGSQGAWRSPAVTADSPSQREVVRGRGSLWELPSVAGPRKRADAVPGRDASGKPGERPWELRKEPEGGEAQCPEPNRNQAPHGDQCPWRGTDDRRARGGGGVERLRTGSLGHMLSVGEGNGLAAGGGCRVQEGFQRSERVVQVPLQGGRAWAGDRPHLDPRRGVLLDCGGTPRRGEEGASA